MLFWDAARGGRLHLGSGGVPGPVQYLVLAQDLVLAQGMGMVTRADRLHSRLAGASQSHLDPPK